MSTAQLLGEIAEDLAGIGHDVSVVTTTPHYNHDQAAVDRQPLRHTRVPWLQRSDFGEVDVTHVAMAGKASGRFARAAQWAWFHLVSAALIWRRRSETDVIFTVSPPLTVATVCGALRPLTRTPFVFGVWEMYPDILVRLGSLHDGALFRALKRHAYRSADRTAFLSSQMLHAPRSTEPAAADRFRVVPTFVEWEVIRPADRHTDLRSEVGIGAEALPSKEYRIMASGRPILGIARGGSPLDNVISTYRAGMCFEPNELDALVDFLDRCAKGEVDLASMGRAARTAAVQRYNRAVVVSQLEQLLLEAAG